MDISLLAAGVLQLMLSLFIGLIFIYAGFRFFHKRIKAINEIEELKKNNIAVAILNASIILALVIMVKNAIEPAITVFSMAIRNPDSTIISFIQMAGIMLVQRKLLKFDICLPYKL